ncbi:MAG: glycosyltransferase [Solirubrobacterales bacterium]|nr:glycosyltransferase [Solirubrobacterales bacterium]
MKAAGRIRVVTLIDRLVQGGAERLAVQITSRLDPERFDRTICVTRWSDAAHADFAPAVAQARADLDAADVRFLGLTRRGRTDVAAWRPLVRQLRNEHTHVVHGHMIGSNIAAVVMGRLARVPIVVSHEHSWAFTGSSWRIPVDRYLIAGRSDVLLACSREDERRMVELEGIRPDQVRFIPNGIDAQPPTPGRSLRDELGIAPGVPVIGSVGTLRPEKRFDVLLEATARARDARPGLRVLIAGEGPERAALEAQIKRLGLEDVVTLLGSRTDVPDILAALDIAVVCSDFEGSPLSVMEYMDAALPVVGSRVGGIPDLVEDGVHGMLVERRDPRALSDALVALLDDPARRKALGEAARARRRAEFDLDQTVRQIEDLYATLLDRRGITVA